MKNNKELKNEYKQKKSPMGVFQIKNIINNNIFIDSSIDMTSKWNRHKVELKFGSHRNKLLQKDWKEYGEEKFVYGVLSELKYKNEENVNYREELKVLEEMVINELNLKEDLIRRDFTINTLAVSLNEVADVISEALSNYLGWNIIYPK